MASSASPSLAPVPAPVLTSATPASCASSAASVIHLSTSRLPLVALRDFYRQALCDKLLSCHPCPNKALVLEQHISSALSLVAEVELLRRHSVEQIYYLVPQQNAKDSAAAQAASTASSGSLVTNCPHLVYVCRAESHLMRIIARQIMAHQASKHKHTYSLLLMHHAHASLDPCDPFAASVECTLTLTQLGVYSAFSHIGALPMTLFPLESDLLSLEQSSSFADLYSTGSTQHLHSVAISIRQLERLYGHIPHFQGKGNMAMRVVNLVNAMQRDEAANQWEADATQAEDQENQGHISQPSVQPLISSLLLVDRVVDVVTPLLTQSTYEGLIDEHYEIRTNCIQVPPEFVQSPPKPNEAATAAATATQSAAQTSTKPVKVSLTSADSLFAQLRNMSLSELGPHLHSLASDIQSTYNQRHTHTQTVSDLSKFVKSFKSAHSLHTSLSLHLAIASDLAQKTSKNNLYTRLQECERQLLSNQEADEALDTIEYCCLSRLVPLHKLLALLVLASQCTNAVKPKRYNLMKQLILQQFGCAVLATLSRLEKMGMCGPLAQSARKSHEIIYKAMSQLQSAESESRAAGTGARPVDLSSIYASHKHVPLLVSLIKHSQHWPALVANGALAQLPGRTFSFQRQADTLYDDYVPALAATESTSKDSTEDRKHPHLTMPINLLAINTNANKTQSSTSLALAKSLSAAASVSAVTSIATQSLNSAVSRMRSQSLSKSASQNQLNANASLTNSAAPPKAQSSNPFDDQDPASVPSAASNTKSSEAGATKPLRPLVLVYFIGGCTYSEVSAIRKLNSTSSARQEYIVATSKLINQQQLIQSMQQSALTQSV